ncbi:ribbon-helix-helix protein, CopG family [Modestobacter sp. Leaf380]|uniref:ribbon-helix-helix protein, CopG family n=1 Tax=Modestobacter sp. Leaf380 TaxID=1736356 RepID=UPI0006FD9092|nr:ribbon-helix-helix protein, CopG family [Modestobacter sp. Leaf380]KQS66547.1 hypothetical protein ASG41_08600 [Modestobacter sp. Leaf380]
MTLSPGPTEVWQARIDSDLAAALREDSAVLGLKGRTEIVRTALELLHQRAAEERMARSVEDFYGDQPAPLPIGVRPALRRDEVVDTGAPS